MTLTAKVPNHTRHFFAFPKSSHNVNDYDKTNNAILQENYNSDTGLITNYLTLNLDYIRNNYPHITL